MALHFADNELDDGQDPLFKIRPILNLVQHTYATHYTPDKELSIDESMKKFKGKFFAKQYMPNKPSKWGIKAFSLCDSKTGFLLKFDVYTGKNESLPDAAGGVGHKVVMSLAADYLDQGRVIYVDNWYSSIPLFEDLRLRNTGATGTIRLIRKGLPEEMKVMKPKKGEKPVFWKNNENTMIGCVWMDTGKVTMLSTVGDTGITQRKVKQKGTANQGRLQDKPNVNIQYISHMGGVDVFDHLCTHYSFDRKNMKWYHVLWHFVKEIALVNGRIVHNLVRPNKEKLSTEKYRQGVIKRLTQGFTRATPLRAGRKSTVVTDNRLVERHYPKAIEDRSHRPNCVVCSIIPAKCKRKGKGDCKRKQVSFRCMECQGQPALCPDPCFRKYHELREPKEHCKCIAK